MSEELGKRAVDCKHWRWMPGMRIRGIDKVCVAVTDKGCVSVTDKGSPIYRDGCDRLGFLVMTYGILAVPHAQPDLTDPATLGCLLALVRDAHKDACMTIGFDGDDWVVCSRWCDYLLHHERIPGGECEVSRGRSEGEALVAALEAAE